MKILVTGATGYIGSHLIKELAETGKHQIFGTDYNLRQNNVDKYLHKLIAWDITQQHFGKFYDFDAVIHLAAKTMVSVSTKIPEKYYLTNIVGTHNLINNVEECGHMIYCSTGAAINPASSPYALSKKAAEDIVIQRARDHTICRFYNVSGNNGFKKFDDSYYHLIRKAAATAAGRFDSINICGTSYDTPDGTAIRNYTHIQDIVNSILRIVNFGPTRKIENLGNATGYSVREVINAMKKVSGVNFNVKEIDARNGDVPKTIFVKQSDFFEETFSLEDQCLSSLNFEKFLLNENS